MTYANFKQGTKTTTSLDSLYTLKCLKRAKTSVRLCPLLDVHTKLAKEEKNQQKKRKTKESVGTSGIYIFKSYWMGFCDIQNNQIRGKG